MRCRFPVQILTPTRKLQQGGARLNEFLGQKALTFSRNCFVMSSYGWSVLGRKGHATVFAHGLSGKGNPWQGQGIRQVKSSLFLPNLEPWVFSTRKFIRIQAGSSAQDLHDYKRGRPLVADTVLGECADYWGCSGKPKTKQLKRLF